MPPKNSKQTKATKVDVLAQQTVTTTTTTTTTTTSTATLAASSTATTEESTYVTDEDKQSVETFVGKALGEYAKVVNTIKKRATSVIPEDIGEKAKEKAKEEAREKAREKAIDTIVDTLIKLTPEKNRFPDFTRTDLKMMAVKLIKKLLIE